MAKITKAEERKRYRLRHPDKVKDEKRRYLDRKIKKKIKENPNILENLRTKLLQDFDKLTRITFDDSLPKHCEICGLTVDLHIHHMQYIYPIQTKHLIRLCRRCHTLEHQKLHPLLEWERG